MKLLLDPGIAEILPVFLAESSESAEVMESAVLRLEKSSNLGVQENDTEAVDEIFRVVHTIKGDAASLGFENLSHFAHRLEGALDLLRSGRAVDSTAIQFLLESVDALREALVAASNQEDRLTAQQAALESRIGLWMTADGASATDTTTKPGNSRGRPEKDAKASSRYLRVDVEKLDQLLTIVGELAVARGAMTEELETGLSREALLTTHHATDRLHLELQELVMRVRMVPVGPAFRRHQRLIRDLCTRLGKEVRFEIEGGDVELDSSVLQLLQDPLSHMLRNAVAHGLETPSERKAAGKAEVGSILLRTSQEGGSILIELRDDGSGIDRQLLQSRAIEMGLLEANSEPDEQELLHLIFEPGLSTSAEVSEVSGRGVGMDVVRRNLELLRSTIEIESESGQSTVMRIRLPLTLAIIDGLVVKVGHHHYVLPVDSVVELIDLDGDICRESRGLVYLREQPMAAALLSDLVAVDASTLPARQTEAGDKKTVAVLRQGSSTVGLILDHIEGKSQVVIKPLPKVLDGISMLAGTSILGSGTIAFVLDLRSVVQSITSTSSPASDFPKS